MEKEKFNLIQNGLEKRINNCKTLFTRIKTTEDLMHVTLEEASRIHDFAKKEESEMTRIVTTELYHLIGMGNLSPQQMMKFIYKIREYLQYRSNLQTLSTGLDSLSNLPKLPSSSKYRLRTLCDITLRSDFNDEDEEEIN